MYIIYIYIYHIYKHLYKENIRSCHGCMFSIATGGSGALNSVADGTLLGGSVGGAGECCRWL